jgi:hypothetical protein
MRSEGNVPEKEMIITVYLNQKVVFDLLAIKENGFAEMHSVQRKEVTTEATSKGVEAEVGTSNVFSFLGVKIGGAVKKDAGKQDDETISETRIHTPTSLLSRLLDYLEADGRIKELKDKSSLATVQNGDFVRFHGSLRQNPIIKTFDSFLNLMSLGTVLREKGPKGSSQQHQGGRDPKQMAAQIKGLVDSLRLGNLVDLLCEMDDGIVAVLQTELQFFNSQNIAQIEEGNYTTVGKVIKISRQGESINLLRNSSLSLAKNDLMDGLVGALKAPEFSSAGMNLPELVYEISNGILVIPMAIYA